MSEQTNIPSSCVECGCRLTKQTFYCGDITPQTQLAGPFCLVCTLRRMMQDSDLHALLQEVENAIDREAKRKSLSAELAELRTVREGMVQRFNVTTAELAGVREELARVEISIDSVQHRLGTLDADVLVGRWSATKASPENPR